MKELKPGDKIKFVGAYSDRCFATSVAGTVDHIFDDGIIGVKINDVDESYCIHRRQVTHRITSKIVKSITKHELLKAYNKCASDDSDADFFFIRTLEGIIGREIK